MGAALFHPVEVTPTDDGVAVPVVYGKAVVGGHVGFSQCGVAGVLNHGLPQHMLGHWNRRRPRHHPREVLVEGSGEHPKIDRRLRPE